MKHTIASDIIRKRLLIEDYYSIEIDESVINNYFEHITKVLHLRYYSEPIIFSPGSGMGKEDNAGYDAFVPLIDSGISLYVWSKQKFVSIVIYTCKDFSEILAINETKNFYQMSNNLITKQF